MADEFPDDMASPTNSFTPINGVKAELMDEDTIVKTEAHVKDEYDDNTEDNLAAVPPVTPQKRGKKGSETGNSAKKAKTTPSSATKKAASIPIPNSFEEAGPEDRMLLHLRDKENKSWPEVAVKWNTVTGASTNGGTLNSRYQRIKAKFVTFDPDHVPMLLQIKKDVEAEFEREKWSKIAGLLEAQAGSKYPTAALQKKFKELSKKPVETVTIKDDD